MNIPVLNFRPVITGGTLVTTFNRDSLNLYQESIIRSEREDLVICDKDGDSKCSLHFTGGCRSPKMGEEIFSLFGYEKIFDIGDFWKIFDELKVQSK